jgi:tRNA(Arg) A34 adenosine deaminase TadA
METALIFLNRAIELSRKNLETEGGGPFGAVIVKENKIVSEGWNQVLSTNDPTAHAEVVAIRKACQTLGTFDLSGCEIFSSCEPCPMCLSSIYWARMGKIFFSNSKLDAANIKFDDAYIYDEIGKPIESRSIPTVQIRSKEALLVFEDWYKKENKILY